MNNDTQIVVNTDYINQMYAASSKKDEEITSLFSKIEKETELLASDDLSVGKKFDSVTSVEFLFFRLRVLVEFEHITVKNILNNPQTPQSLKPFFTKRDVYLAQICQKLAAFREDLAVLQKLVYTSSFNTR